jgi:hypothetical protein
MGGAKGDSHSLHQWILNVSTLTLKSLFERGKKGV